MCIRQMSKWLYIQRHFSQMSLLPTYPKTAKASFEFFFFKSILWINWIFLCQTSFENVFNTYFSRTTRAEAFHRIFYRTKHIWNPIANSFPSNSLILSICSFKTIHEVEDQEMEDEGLLSCAKHTDSNTKFSPPSSTPFGEIFHLDVVRYLIKLSRQNLKTFQLYLSKLLNSCRIAHVPLLDKPFFFFYFFSEFLGNDVSILERDSIFTQMLKRANFCVQPKGICQSTQNFRCARELLFISCKLLSLVIFLLEKIYSETFQCSTAENLYLVAQWNAFKFIHWISFLLATKFS